MEGTVVALGIGAGLLGVIEPAFRPIAAGAIVLGGIAACIMVWRRRGDSHPSISRHAHDETDANKSIGPK
jgi:hypothetical protein